MGGPLTKAADFRATPESIGHALPYPGAHQCISGIAGEDGSRPIDRHCSNAVPTRGCGELSTGDDWKDHKELNKPVLRQDRRHVPDKMKENDDQSQELPSLLLLECDAL